MKSKIIVIAMLFMAFSFKTISQNLIPNYSFEDTIHCPIYASFQGYVTSWSGSYPGYYSTYCNEGGDFGVPNNQVGYQYAHTGVAYVGIYTYINYTYDTNNYNLRDYIQDSLVYALKAGMKYYVTFYVSLADSDKYACNNIGACFSDSLLNVHTRKVLSYHTPQVTNDTSNHLTDKINWTKVTGSFIALGGEKYITIGNFVDDKHSYSIFVNSSGSTQHLWTASYYYIDDVIVSPDSNYADSLLSATQIIIKPQEQISVYPNPNNGIFTMNIQNYSGKQQLDIYDMLGQKIFSQHSIPDNEYSINLSSQSKGIYLYRITSLEGGFISQGKLIIQR